MILILVFLGWTFMLSLKGQEVELVLGGDVNRELGLNTELTRMILWNGSGGNMTVPFITDIFDSLNHLFPFFCYKTIQ